MEVWLAAVNKLLRRAHQDAGKKRNAQFTCASLFWWYAMASGADITVTPHPIYKADGRKLPDCYSIRLSCAMSSQHGSAGSCFSSEACHDRRIQPMVRDRQARVATRDPTPRSSACPTDYALQRIGPDDPAIATISPRSTRSQET
jgi:hypothetical protein